MVAIQYEVAPHSTLYGIFFYIVITQTGNHMKATSPGGLEEGWGRGGGGRGGVKRGGRHWLNVALLSFLYCLSAMAMKPDTV